jgi:hypothetical protein
MKKQTAVEWFFNKMKSHFEHDGDLFETVCMTYAIAKAKEKEQLENAISNGISKSDMIDNRGYFNFDKWYNETYGGDK